VTQWFQQNKITQNISEKKKIEMPNHDDTTNLLNWFLRKTSITTNKLSEMNMIERQRESE